MKISLIISTYNWIEALELTLISILKQKVKPFEIIIADDGSKKQTKDLIDCYRDKFNIPLIHVWHEDKGFRLAEIRNKAIIKAKGDFICQIDGDIILHPNFILDYQKFVRPGFYYRGSRVRLNEELSKKLIETKTTKISYFEKGLLSRFNSFRSRLLSLVMSAPKKESKNALGCNMGFWKKDLITINGYSNNLVGWGHEDEELCARLININIYKKRIKHLAIAYHIYHKENSKITENSHIEMIKNVINNKITKTTNGIKELI